MMKQLMLQTRLWVLALGYYLAEWRRLFREITNYFEIETVYRRHQFKEGSEDRESEDLGVQLRFQTILRIDRSNT